MSNSYFSSSSPMHSLKEQGVEEFQLFHEKEHARGISDGLNPAVVNQEHVAKDARIRALIADLHAKFAPARVRLQTEFSQLKQEIEKYGDHGPKVSSPLLRAISGATSFAGLTAFEVVLAKPVMGLYGYGDLSRTTAAIGAVMTPALLLEMAISTRHPLGSVLNRPVTRCTAGCAALAIPVAVAAYRCAHLPVEAALHGGALVHALEIARTPATILIMLLAPVLTATGAFFIERVKHYYDLFKLHGLQRRANRNEIELAVLDEEENCAKACLEASGEVQHAEYMRGVIKGRTEEQPRTWLPPFLRKVSLPTLIGIIALVVVLFVLTSCGFIPEPPKHSIAIVDDYSGSISTTLEQHPRNVMTILSRASCANVTVIPVNATIHDPLEVTLPCEDADGYGDEFKKAYKRAEDELRIRSVQWAKDSNGSDYAGAIQLASRVLAGGKTKKLIIIGDFKHSGGNGEFRMVKGVPALADVNLAGTKLFLGFIESRGTGRSTAPFRASWMKALQKVGVLEGDITSAPFGLDELKGWAETNIGPVKPAYEKYAEARR